tara:strand:- start:12232 stop:13143 length:912 start_codon:yes stop_codon:yes gene_type:complete
MNRLFKVLLFLGFLWVLSFGIASLMTSDNSIKVSRDTIAVIPIEGVITLNGGSSFLSSSLSAIDTVNKIKDANSNENVKGIVLEINSPGGTVMGSKKIADALKEVEKPTVAVISEYGTSGAYWAASQADLIVADELSIVGSIGVIGSYLDFSGFLDDHNVTYQRLVTGTYKDISSPYKELTEEESDLIQERLEGIHDYFVKDVAEGRAMEISEVEALAEGLFYLGMNSVDIGLVDELGDREDAIAFAEELAGISDGTISEYIEEESWFDSIFNSYGAYSSFYIGQGIGTALVAGDAEDLSIRV